MGRLSLRAALLLVCLVFGGVGRLTHSPSSFPPPASSHPPAGFSNVAAYEMFPTNAAEGLFAAQQDEAHFYTECSGKGDCDRSTGECKCYVGYTGSACQRSE
jgi:hypothetical protein